ncbi:ribokinase-like [Tubulanus polymorphus]|uniref:ribokinase-like n=1 Tax=Tubulanus polymorphus TaxID=672921 RepID=UPI003DA379DA
MDVIVVGSCIVDLVSYAPRLPKAGETLIGTKFSVGFGGKGANQCVAAAKLGAKVAMLSKVGDDQYGKDYIENLRQLNIDTNDVSTAENTSTGVAQITVCDDGTNAIVVVLAACNEITIADVEKAEDVIKSSRVLVCQLEVPIDVTCKALQLAKKHGVKSIFNPAPAVKNLPPALYKICDIFCANETEAEILTGIKLNNLDDAKAAVLNLLELGCQLPMITLGAEGVVFATQDDRTVKHVPSRQVEAFDTTGAGDSFIGSLAFYISTFPKLSFEEVIRRANYVASVSVQAAGTQTSFPERKNLPDSIFTEN